ncbi:MAG: IS21-like element helper ATPase IstB [Proteobacteria bacterium]|nr:IS21-like element helper ATPase IstB [Pseudomonadota bacterium]
MIEITIDKLIEMRLHGMVAGLKEQVKNTAYKNLCFEERFSMLVDKEKTYRENKKLTSLLRQARLRYSHACIEDIDYRSRRGITKEMLLRLSNNDWIRDKRNIIITGATGAGKTYLSCVFANNACRAGIRTYYVRIPRLLQELKISRGDGSYVKLLKKLSRIDLLVLDDWGLSVLSDTERRDFLEIAEDRHNLRSTIISSQVPVDTWHDVIGDPTIADAICDRLIHNAYKIELTGESMRKRGEDTMK